MSASVVTLLCAGLVACTTDPTSSPSSDTVSPTESITRAQVVVSENGDPLPELKAEVHTFDASGGEVEDMGVMVTVPPDASDGLLETRFGEGFGIVDTGLAMERFGPLVQVDHTEDLRKPLRVTWDVSHLEELELATIGLARWDPDLEVWTPTPEIFTVRDGALTADISEFSILTWITNAAAWTTQIAGEVSGKRAPAPTCNDTSSPSWVTNVVRPDEDQPAMPIRTCVETRDQDVLGVKVVNNRPYTQALTLSDDATASSTPIDEDFTIVGIIHSATSSALSAGNRVVIPPTRTSDINVARPSMPGSFSHKLTVEPSAIGVGVDVLVYVLENAFNLDAIGGFDSELLNEAVQLTYDCGGKKVLETRDFAIDVSVVTQVTEVMAQCASNDKVALMIEGSLRAQISKGGKTAEQAIKSARVVKQAFGTLTLILTMADFSSYTAELLTGAKLGPVSIGVYGRGQPPVLGSWTPSCANVDEDSAALYTNLTIQDDFSNTDKDFWEFDGWQPSAAIAVEPLTECSVDHQMAVAAEVEQTWEDKKAAAAVSETIRSQTEGVGGSLPGLPVQLRGQWCARSEPGICFDEKNILAEWPEAFIDDSSEGNAPGSTFYTLCLAPDLGIDGCSVAFSVYLEYFPAGVSWDCEARKVETGDFPACDPDYSSAHDISFPRLVIPPNHQHNINYADTEPMYQTKS